jgi:hypothetical protein
LVGSLALTALTACGGAPFHPATPADVDAASPLGPSYVLVPLPSDYDALLGRVLSSPVDRGRSLEEVSRPNECADRLAPAKESALAATFEDTQPLATGGKAGAALATFGFEGDAWTATHFHYRLDVSKRVARADTPDYVECCKAKGTCGYGYVSALVYGSGEYATLRESSARGSVTVPVAGEAGGPLSAAVLHRRKVAGFVAALVTMPDAGAARSLSVLGDPAAAATRIDEQSLPDQLKRTFETEKIRIVGGRGRTVETAYEFRDGNGSLTENEFVRRYGALTGSDDLSGADRMRRLWLVLPGAGLMLAGGALLVYGLTNLPEKCNPDFNAVSGACETAVYPVGQQPAGWVPSPGAPAAGYYSNANAHTTNPVDLAIALGGAAIGAGGAVMFFYGLDHMDGAPSDHVITRSDAERYAVRYNRALLRQAIRETREKMTGLARSAGFHPHVTPILAPTYVGLQGTF